MKQKIVGDYYAGNDSIQLVVRGGNGGEFYVSPEKGSTPRIQIGVEHQDWMMIRTALLHEIMELVLDKLKCRFDPTNDFSRAHSAYLFVMGHTNFSDACWRVSEFMDEAVPDLKNAWKLWNKKGKK